MDRLMAKKVTKNIKAAKLGKPHQKSRTTEEASLLSFSKIKLIQKT